MPDQNRTYPPRRRKPKRRLNPNFIIIVVLALILAVLVVAAIVLTKNPPAKDNGLAPAPTTAPTSPSTEPSVPDSSDPITQPTDPSTAPSTEPSTEPTVPSTEPSAPVGPAVVGSANIVNTGDILMHMPCVNPCAIGDGKYDFSPYFTHITPYVSAFDYAVVNFETTTASLKNGYKYSGVPNLNTPDEIVTALKNAGFDMLLTANNHTYDTQTQGFFRTQEVIRQNGLDYTGTISDPADHNFLIKEIDGIRIGMICYTYETNADPDKVALNVGPTLSKDIEALINTFYKTDMDTYRKDLTADLAAMRAAGAEAIVLYMHWGEEYVLQHDSNQTAMAQIACDLGVDVIVGGHPHVVQPMELLTNSNNPEQKTICLYSTGNALSNQRQGNLPSYIQTAHTEDGALFSFRFVKYEDGTVRVEDVELVPLWCNMYTSSATGKVVYDLLPLDPEVEDWKTELDLTDSSLKKAQDSFDRTMAIVGEGLEEIKDYLATLPPVE